MTALQGERRCTAGQTVSRAGRWAVIGAGMLTLLIIEAVEAQPPLPTPCVAGNCGTHAPSFVTYGQASAVAAGSAMTVTQSSAQAILNWADFNIANGYNVNFQQPSASAAVLNKIWSANPSVIAGALRANGQVYLYNQNGIVFDKTAQIDVGSLIASTLALTPVNGDPDYLFKNGLLSQNPVTGSFNTLPSVFQAVDSTGAAYNPGTVSVNSGATLTSASGGRIMLLGSAVSNAGTISSPNGQTVLAAGNQIYLAASSDAALRGFLIEVNASGLPAAAGGAGIVSNAGTISADTGNITLAGLVVNQAGLLSATTSVSQNGSIYLVAGDTSSKSSAPFYDNAASGFGGLLPNSGGALTLAPGSVTQVLSSSSDHPGDTSTISEQNLSNGAFLPSQIELVGQNVALRGNAAIHAPGATINVRAAGDPNTQFVGGTTVSADGGQIYLDTGSSIDVSGEVGVSVPVTRNIIGVTLEGSDLQDDTLLRNGFLHGQAVTVDANVSSTLFNVAPYVGNIGIGIDEVLTAGGNIHLLSDGGVITRAGSSLNVSGGSVAFQGGNGPAITLLQGADGKTQSIETASSNIPYVGLANSYSYTDPTWGTSTNLNPQNYYPGYTQGNSAGGLLVQAPEVYLRGSMLGSTIAGPNQRLVSDARPTSPLSSYGSAPSGGLFVLGCDCSAAGGDTDYDAPAVQLQDGALDALGAFDPFQSTLPASLQALTTLSPTQLTQGGFSQITLYSTGSVTLAAGSLLQLAAGGALAVSADGAIDIAGNIAGSGASVSLTTIDLVTPGERDVSLEAGAAIDVSGNWVNDSPLFTNTPGNPPPNTTIASAGGSVSLSAGGNLRVGADSRIEVSGGGWVNASNALSAGAAGKIGLSASYQQELTSTYTGALILGVGARLVGDSLTAGKGGSLALSSGSVTVGSTAMGTPGELLLAPALFDQQGFQRYAITGLNDVVIGGGNSTPVVLAPLEENLVFSAPMLREPSGTALESFTTLEALPGSLRAGVSVSFTSPGTKFDTGADAEGNILLDQNAAIIADPQSTVALLSGDRGSISILGDIVAPAGVITAQIGGSGLPAQPVSSDDVGYLANQSILIGANATLDARGASEVNTLNALGYRRGSVLNGGTISLQAYKGYVVTEAGSTIDVSGVADTVDITGAGGVSATLVADNAGSIVIDAREGLVLRGALLGQAARSGGLPVAGAGGGSLSIGLDLFNYFATAFGDADQNNPLANPYPLTARTLSLSAQAPSALSGALVSGQAQLSTASLEAGGFDNITLKSADLISFNGAVSLSSKASLTLDAPMLLGTAGSEATLSAGYVALGNYFNDPLYFVSGNPTATAVQAAQCSAAAAICNATLSVTAQLIDIRGQSAWSGFGNENLASTGDIRFALAGSYFGDLNHPQYIAGLNSSGNLSLTAAQLYPTSYTPFTLSAANTVSIARPAGATALPATPLSAAGALTIEAQSIVQDGVVRAPLGQITLQGIDTLDSATGQVSAQGSVTLGVGSVTSVSADGTDIPYGSTVNGQQWTYAPQSGVTEVIGVLPAKNITLQASNVSVAGTLDLSGGGELLAWEYVTGPGGSTDVLDSSSTAANGAGLHSYQYAIVPSLGSGYAPIDAQYQSQQGSGLPADTPNATAQQIYLSAVPGLRAGYYALLPARYAQLPGAYAIRIVQSNSDLAAGSVIAQANGSFVVAGRLAVAGTDILDSRTSTVLVAPSAVVQQQSQYLKSTANAFFSAAASSSGSAPSGLPADAGALQIAASNHLALGGTLEFATASFAGTDADGNAATVQGAGGVVSIQAPSILISDTGAAADPSGALQLSAQALDNLGAQTLVLGAQVQATPAGEKITAAVTQTIALDNSQIALSAPALILAAQGAVTVSDGAQLIARGALNQPPGTLVLQGVGALLEASGASSVPTVLVGAPGPTGTLSIGHGALLEALNGQGKVGGSLLLYSTGGTTAQPDASLSALALGLYSQHVSLGAVPGGGLSPSGLTLSSQLLGTLSGIKELTIGSSSTIDFYGSVNLGTSLHSLSFNAAGLNGYDVGSNDPDDVTLQAGSIALENTSATASSTYGAASAGTGVLSLIASPGSAADSGAITLGVGVKAIQGFGGGVALSAASDIEAEGKGATLTVSSGAGSTGVNLSLTGAALSSAAGADQTVSATGTVTIAQAATSSLTPPAPAFGGKLAINGDAITQNGTIALPAGILTLHATAGDVVLQPGSVTDAAGGIEGFTVTNAAAAGGSVTLLADRGNVTLQPGATLDVSGAQSADGSISGDAGTLQVLAPNGQFNVTGSTLKGAAPAGRLQGSFTLDEAQGLAGTGFETLLNALQAGGFTGALSLRARGDPAVTVGGMVQASSFELAADQGSIEVAGTINTSGGDIALWAQGNLTLDPSAQLLANAGATGPIGINGQALATHGGNVTLGTESGLLVLNGGMISLLGSADASTDGTLTLHAPRTADDLGVRIDLPSSGTVEADTRRPIIAEGFELYGSSSNVVLGDPSLGSLDITAGGAAGTPFGDAQTFVSNGNAATLAASIAAGFSNPFGAASPVLVQVRPGIAIDSGGNLTVGDAHTTVWNLDSWNAALGAPVDVTLRASGNLIFNASMSDGFTQSGPAVASWNFGGSGAAADQVASASNGSVTASYGVSANYRLAAGADLSSANPLAVTAVAINAPTAAAAAAQGGAYLAAPGSGNVIVAPNTIIRTGDGNIGIAAGGDVLLGYSASLPGAAGRYDSYGNLEIPAATAPLSAAVYTAGVPSVLSAAQSLLFSPLSLKGLPAPAYPTEGGVVSVQAANDIQSVPSEQSASDWLWRAGGSNASWWVQFSQFQQGFGALGGGSLALQAAGDIENVSAVVPTTGRMLNTGAVASNANLVVTGGGTLSVAAGGDIASGVFEDDWGDASINAGGSITTGTTLGKEITPAELLTLNDPNLTSSPVYPVLLAGGGTLAVGARGDVLINFIGNSTALPLSTTNQSAVGRRGGGVSFFYTYTPASATRLESSGGDITLLNTESNLPLTALNFSDGRPLSVSRYNGGGPLAYPPTLDMVSLSGDLMIENTGHGTPLELYPSSSGTLNLLAHGSIDDGLTQTQSADLSNGVFLTMDQTNPLLWPNPALPQGGNSGPLATSNTLPAIPLHQGDRQPVFIVAKTGNLYPSDFVFPKAADLIAGGNIYDLRYAGENLQASDVTLIEAGGSVDYSTPTQPVSNALQANISDIQLQGPGYLEVLAGQSVNLGDSRGIVSNGNLNDTRLPSGGATILVGAGFGESAEGSLRDPAYQAFISRYLAPDALGNPSPYALALVDYLAQLDPSAYSALSYGAALADFQALKPSQQLPLIANVLSDELSATGLAHTTQGTSYMRGLDAIATLFPTSDADGHALTYAGDLNMFYSQVKTAQGGDVNLLVPGGSVVVGVPNPAANLATVSGGVSNLGVLVLGEGAIQGYANQSFEVNQSRMLTLEGGNIILWASSGDIDAGKGAKSASAAPPPVVQYNPNTGQFEVDISNSVSGSGIGQLLSQPGETAGLVNLIAPNGTVNAGDAGIRVAGNLNIAAVQVLGAGNITVTGTSTGVPVSAAGALAGALSGANSLGDASKSAIDQVTNGLAAATDYNQLSESLVPSFIVVKLFCLGIECEAR